MFSSRIWALVAEGKTQIAYVTLERSSKVFCWKQKMTERQNSYIRNAYSGKKQASKLVYLWNYLFHVSKILSPDLQHLNTVDASNRQIIQRNVALEQCMGQNLVGQRFGGSVKIRKVWKPLFRTLCYWNFIVLEKTVEEAYFAKRQSKHPPTHLQRYL